MPQPLRVTPVVSLQDLVPRLADEGIPVAAIARATRQPRDKINEHIQDAIDKGIICEAPSSDWPPGVPRSQRTAVAPQKKRGLVDDDVVMKCIRFFRVTQLQACFIAVLIVRDEVSKETFHHVIEQQRGNPDDETDLKMVDVIMCNLRKKLRPFGIEIETIWSKGYCLNVEGKKTAIGVINQQIAAPVLPPPAPPPSTPNMPPPVNTGVVDVFRL